MEWHNEAEQGFPPQRHQEPLALRQDILDELTDHLALAADRESESGVEDEREIRTRVINQFGSPTAVARALWWDAMKETIVKDWIQITLNALLCIGVIGFMTLFYNQMQTTNNALLSALNERPATAESLYPSVEFIVHRGTEDGEAAEGLQFRLTGKPFNEDTAIISEESDMQGRVEFGPVRAGQYRVNATDQATGMSIDKSITLYSGDETKTVHLVAPPLTQSKVSLDTAAFFPAQSSNKDFHLLTFMEVHWSFNGDNWSDNRIESNPGFRRRSQIDYNTIVTSDGLFDVRNPGTTKRSTQPGEEITQVYGNRITFSKVNLASREQYENEKSPWYKIIPKEGNQPYNWDLDLSYDLQTDATNPIALELPDELLNVYTEKARMIANNNHGLPERFAWFPEIVSQKFPDYVIDEARLVERSRMKRWVDDKYIVSPANRENSIIGTSGHYFSLENAPEKIPGGYKLLLAFKSINSRILSLDEQLYGYLDPSPPLLFDIRGGAHMESEEYPSPYDNSDPILKIPVSAIEREWQGFAYFDLTDAINHNENFREANGVIFRWATESKNFLYIKSPESAAAHEQPVWLILKPFDSMAVSDTKVEDSENPI